MRHDTSKSMKYQTLAAALVTILYFGSSAPLLAAQAPNANKKVPDPAASAVAVQASEKCMSDLQAFNDKMQKGGHWLGGAGTGYGYPMSGYAGTREGMAPLAAKGADAANNATGEKRGSVDENLVQKTGTFMVGWIKGLAEWWSPHSQLTEKDISPYFWPNGTMPASAEFNELVAGSFSGYRLRIGGLAEHAQSLSLAELKAIAKQEQITTHFCIQGWSGVAKWGGVPMRSIIDLVQPTTDAHYVVFYSFADGGEGGRYYDVHKIGNMRHELTLLAYEMNGAPLSILHGAPLRLRCENELGFKMVKWIASIEFVREFSDLGAGQGGYNEDHEFYGYRMPI